MAHNLLKAVGVGAVALTLFAFKKKKDFSKVLEQMTIDMRSIRNLRQSNGKVYFNFDLGFHNPTEYDLILYTAGLIKLRKIEVYYGNKLFGSTTSEVTKFELPAKSNYLISNIQTELLLLNVVKQFLSGGLDTNPDSYKIQITVEALGKTWIIDK